MDYEEANIAELKRVIVFTSINDTVINVKQFEVNQDKPINETDVKNRTLALREIGPRFDLSFRRDKIASHELYKTACKVPRTQNPEKKKQRKNLFTDELGQQKGKVFLQHQDLDTLATRKFKKAKKDQKEGKVAAQDV